MNDRYAISARKKFNEMFNKDIDYIIKQIGIKIEDNILVNFAFMDDDEINNSKAKFVEILQQNLNIMGIEKVKKVKNELKTFCLKYKSANDYGVVDEAQIFAYYLAYYMALIHANITKDDANNYYQYYNTFILENNNDAKRRVHPGTMMGEDDDDGIKKGVVHVKQSLVRRCLNCFTRKSGGKGITKLRKRHRHSKHRKQKVCHRKSLCKRRVS